MDIWSPAISPLTGNPCMKCDHEAVDGWVQHSDHIKAITELQDKIDLLRWEVPGAEEWWQEYHANKEALC